MAEWSTAEKYGGWQQVMVFKATLKYTERDTREAQASAVPFLGKLTLIILTNNNLLPYKCLPQWLSGLPLRNAGDGVEGNIKEPGKRHKGATGKACLFP